MAQQNNSRLRRAATAVGATASIVALAATQPPLATVAVAPAALIVAGSSTNQTGAGIADFYGARFKPADPDDIVYVHFSEGPDGIVRAVQEHAGESNVIISSGWGAGYASVARTTLAGEPGDNLWLLDNSVVTPDGGFGPRYPRLSELVGVPTEPTPMDIGDPAASTAYVYDYNSGAPKYPFNAFSTANTFMAWLLRRTTLETTELPVNDDGSPQCPGGAASCTVTTSDGVIAHVQQIGNVTYVTYDPGGLPLTAPLRALGELGNQVADLIEPALTALVNWGYPNNDPIGDPSQVRPARLLPTPAENARFVKEFVAGIREGLASLGPDKPSAAPVSTLAAETSTEPEGLAPSSKPKTNVVREGLRFSPGDPTPETSSASSDVKPEPGSEDLAEDTADSVSESDSDDTAEPASEDSTEPASGDGAGGTGRDTSGDGAGGTGGDTAGYSAGSDEDAA